jgi:hypothetical protein
MTKLGLAVFMTGGVYSLLLLKNEKTAVKEEFNLRKPPSVNALSIKFKSWVRPQSPSAPKGAPKKDWA